MVTENQWLEPKGQLTLIEMLAFFLDIYSYIVLYCKLYIFLFLENYILIVVGSLINCLYCVVYKIRCNLKGHSFLQLIDIVK